MIDAIIDLIPDDWLDDQAFETPRDQRAAYRAYLSARLLPPRAFLEEAIGARAQLI